MSCREILFCQNRNTCILNSAAEGIAFQCFYSSLHVFLTHNIRILSHGAEQVSVVDQVIIASDLSKPTPTILELPEALMALPVPVVEPSLQPKIPTTP